MSPYPPHLIERSELRVLPLGGSRYQLHVGLPPSYSTDRERRYPVVYASDGYWSFPMVAKMRDLLSFDRAVPEFIVVGLGYAGENLDYEKLRWNELSPVPLPDAPATSGHAAEFLRTIEDEMIPLVEREYRVDPSFRVLAGSSLGGLFTLFAMHGTPQPFRGFIAVTPAVMVGNDWIFQFEDAFAAMKEPIEGRLFMSVGGEEPAAYADAVRRFHSRVVARKYPELSVRFSVIEEAGHCGGIFEGYVRGLRFMFASAPSR
ncbi:MAG: besA 2 [Verrucomicrobia bacterium]|nr:besA 2 [Verrucomicrobiota bacterium]